MYLHFRSVFAPSCVSHTVLTKRDWKNIKINSVSLPMALHCWQTETRFAKINKSRPGRANKNNSSHQDRRVVKNNKKTAENMLKRKHKTRNDQRTRGTRSILFSKSIKHC